MTDFTQETPKIPKQYSCEVCAFSTANKKDYNRHLLTRKHESMTQTMTEHYNITQKNPNKNICEHCNNEYSSRQYLWKHKKICKSKSIVREQPNQTEQLDHPPQPNTTNNMMIDKEMFLQLVQDNQDFKRMLIELAQKNHPTTNNTMNNTLNNNNQKFNLNLYLNETCKNAVNWTDFVKNIQVSQDDLIYNGPLGFSNAMTNIIMNNLNQYSETERPIHCTDLKRKSVYIKDDNEWEIQKNDTKFMRAIKYTSAKCMKTYLDTQDEEPDMEECKQTAMMVGCNSIILTGENEEKIPKVINNILKNVTIDKTNFATIS